MATTAVTLALGAMAAAATAYTFKSVSAGDSHTCAVKADDSLICWGSNATGRATPPAGIAKSVSAGGDHSCAVMADDSLACWGSAAKTTNTPTGGFRSVSAGGSHSCAIKANDEVACWGNNASGQVTPLPGTFQAASAGGSHTCAIRVTGTVGCWGKNDLGQATSSAAAYKSVDAGFNHTCAIKADDSLVCWGSNADGKATSPSGSYKAVSAGGSHTCAIKLTGGIQCWGSNIRQQLLAPGGTYKSLDAGGSHTCALKTDDSVVCWGDNTYGQRTVPANKPPTSITLSGSAVAENQPAGTEVGTLSSADPDPGDTFTYTLVSGTGSADNASFQIAGAKLKTAAAFDFETKSSFSVRVQTDDGHGNTFQQALAISVTNVNEAPTDVFLSSATVAENQASGTEVGTLSSQDSDAADTFTYSLATGPGDADNASFQIAGAKLKTNAILDADLRSGYSIRVQTDDGHGHTFSRALAITVTNVNEAPTDLVLSNSSVAEGQPAETDVGRLKTTDPDPDESFTYTLVPGRDDDDNASFQLAGDLLKTSEVFEFATKSSYKVRVQTEDGSGHTLQLPFTITVTQAAANAAPAVSGAADDVNGYEGSPLTASGSFSDPDGDWLSLKVDKKQGTFTDNGDGTWSWSLTPTDDRLATTLIVTASDGHGHTATDTFVYSAANKAPVLAPLGLTAGGPAHCTLTLKASFSDAGSADTHSGTVDWGDGSTLAAFTASPVSKVHSYARAGVYPLRVVVADDDRGSAQRSNSWTVFNKATGPLAPINSDGSSAFALGSTVAVVVKVATCAGESVRDLSPEVSLTRVKSAKATTVNETVSDEPGDKGTTMHYDTAAEQYVFQLATRASQFNAGEDLTAGNYRVLVSDPTFDHVTGAGKRAVNKTFNLVAGG